ncbi:MAG TPA: hypothetical protein VLX44_08805 [Xanthobacteraceae bacterium]|nr:hypothetical protein [Xanthobacteraceae bacterium]
MRWVRSHIRLGSRLALFALAVQFVVSFGHIHFDGRTLTPAKSIATALLDGTRAASPAAPADQPGKATDPGCALIQLASTSPPATAPTLPPLTAFVRVRPQTPDAVFLALSPHFSFQARAPPAA